MLRILLDGARLLSLNLKVRMLKMVNVIMIVISLYSCKKKSSELPEIKDERLTTSEEVFFETVQPVTQKYCISCHGDKGDFNNQFPSNNKLAHDLFLERGFINLNNVDDSKVLEKLSIRGSHTQSSGKCIKDCEEILMEMSNALQEWLPSIDISKDDEKSLTLSEKNIQDSEIISESASGDRIYLFKHDLSEILEGQDSIKLQLNIIHSTDSKGGIFILSDLTIDTNLPLVVKGISIKLNGVNILSNPYRVVDEILEAPGKTFYESYGFVEVDVNGSEEDIISISFDELELD